MSDSETKELLGHFYLDLYPRDSKFNHAAVFPLIGRSYIKGKLVHPAAAMVVNLNRGDTPKDSLLNHY